MRVPLVAGNWKMNLTPPEAVGIASALAPAVAGKSGVEIVLCPTYLALPAVQAALKGSNVSLGAQDVFWADAGAFTGRISAPMLRSVGVTHCIVGHSETRGRFGKLETPESTVPFFAETDETVKLKIQTLLAHGLVPILCVGETLAEREAGTSDDVIRAQLAGALAGFDESELGPLVVAYEPVWAIGTGKTCESAEAERVCGMIRAALTDSVSEHVGMHTRILYGGSVKSSNSAELFRMPNIDGGLVGGASLVADEFARIVQSA